MKGFFYSKYFLMGLAVLSFAACSDEDAPLSDLDWRCSNDAYADHAGDCWVLPSTVRLLLTKTPPLLSRMPV